MLPALARATSSVLSRLGENAVLRGTVNCKAHIDRDVQLSDRDGNLFVATQVVTIANQNAPVADQTLVIGAESFILQTLIDDNGYSSRFIARKV